MYLRHSTTRKNGKAHTYWRLVRSVREGSRVRQETVAHLGEIDAKGRAKASAIARHFLGKNADQLDLFEDRTSLEPQRIHVNKVRVEKGRGFGDVWLGWKLWCALGLDDFCAKSIPEGKERVPWSDVAAILVIARLCEPSSELHIAEDWYRKTALPDILGVRAEFVHHTRLYQGLDRLVAQKAALEAHLKERLGTLFKLDYDLLLYDVTSTYFEGDAKGVSLAARGYSRDRRPDCKQVCVGLVVTRDGYPIGYEVFAGNKTDVTTVETIVQKMEDAYGKPDRIWVMDRGMISAENLAWLRDGGRRYILGTPKSELRRWQREITEKIGWNEIRKGLEVKLCSGPDGAETFILCRSEDRQRKERAIHDRFSARIEENLESLERRLEHASKPVPRGPVERQIGRMLQRNSRAASHYQVDVDEDASRPSKLRVRWTENRAWIEWARLTEGAYVLRSNVTDWSDEDLWRAYAQLSDAEAAFRIHKSDLKIRPIWHHGDERVKAHILVCFLGYVMWKTLEGWQSRAGLGNSPRTILEELRRIEGVDVYLPVVDGPELVLRCVVQPDKDQAALLDRLGLRLPQRLRMPRSGGEM